MTNPTVTIDKEGNLHLVISTNNPPVPSASGKSLVVASTRGNIPTTTEVDGKPLIIGFNAYIKK